MTAVIPGGESRLPARACTDRLSCSRCVLFPNMEPVTHLPNRFHVGE